MTEECSLQPLDHACTCNLFEAFTFDFIVVVNWLIAALMIYLYRFVRPENKTKKIARNRSRKKLNGIQSTEREIRSKEAMATLDY